MFTIKQVAAVRNNREQAVDDDWGEIQSVIEIDKEFDESSLAGINEFSHLEIIFLFHRVKEDQIQYGARHPRNNKEWPKVGIFAQRGKNRPNTIGTTIVKLLRAEGRSLYVCGLDAIDGTPVVDIKPVMKEFLPKEEIRQPFWVSELMKNYWESTDQ